MNRIEPSHDGFWSRVHAALDERRDPYADPAIAGELARRPELLEPLAGLLRPLESLEGVPQTTPQVALRARQRRPLARLAAAAALLATAGAFGALALRRGHSPRFTFEPSRGTVLSLRAEYVRIDGTAWRSTRIDVLRGAREFETVLALPARDPRSDSPSVSVLAAQFTSFGGR